MIDLSLLDAVNLEHGSHPAGDGVAQRFWSKVSVRSHTECWEWTGHLSNKGYGAIKIDGKMIKAHRVAYELAGGLIPPREGVRGMCICHHCDNPKCCNPAHLFLGSDRDNAMDRQSKGRSRNLFPPGSAHPRFKVHEFLDASIRELRTQGLTQQQIADRTGVSRGHISKVLSGKGANSVNRRNAG